MKPRPSVLQYLVSGLYACMQKMMDEPGISASHAASEVGEGASIKVWFSVNISVAAFGAEKHAFPY